MNFYLANHKWPRIVQKLWLSLYNTTCAPLGLPTLLLLLLSLSFRSHKYENIFIYFNQKHENPIIAASLLSLTNSLCALTL